jgi:hypothetical protein
MRAPDTVLVLSLIPDLAFGKCSLGVNYSTPTLAEPQDDLAGASFGDVLQNVDSSSSSEVQFRRTS